MAREARGIQSIEVGGRVLTVLTAASSPLSLKDLASSAQLAPAQCHAYLTSYRHIGLVEQDPQSGQYRLGPLALRLGIGRMRSVPAFDAAGQEIAAMSRDSGHMALMVVWGPHGPTIAQVHQGTSTLTLNIRHGTLFSVTGTASGRLFAAFGSYPNLDELVARELDGGTTYPSVGPAIPMKQFEAAVTKAKKLGYAEAVDTPIPGISALSAPIFDEGGGLALVITIIGRTDNLEVTPNSPTVTRLLDVSRRLSQSKELSAPSGNRIAASDYTDETESVPT